MLPVVKEIIETVLQQNASSILRAVPLRNDAVQQRIDEMSSEVLKQLVEVLSIPKHSLQIDKSTLSGNKSQLLGYVRFIHNMEAQEEMIFAISLSQQLFSMQWRNFMRKRKYLCKIYCNVQQAVLQQWFGSIEDSLH